MRAGRKVAESRKEGKDGRSEGVGRALPSVVNHVVVEACHFPCRERPKEAEVYPTTGNHWRYANIFLNSYQKNSKNNLFIENSLYICSVVKTNDIFL